jgi:hypothetical protein
VALATALHIAWLGTAAIPKPIRHRGYDKRSHVILGTVVANALLI